MARPRGFDTDQVLSKVIDVFWSKGFDRTSFKDLERVTGLKKGSLFAAFGDKESLFARALERYHKQRCEDFVVCDCPDSSPTKLLRAWLTQVFQISTTTKNRRGCFLVNTIIGMGPKTRRCEMIVQENRKLVEAMLEKLVTRGIARHEFSDQISVTGAVQFILCVVTGMHASSRSLEHDGFSAVDYESLIECTLRALRSENLLTS